MSVNLVSTTDSDEAVLSALGQKKPEAETPVEEKTEQSATDKEPVEKSEASEPLDENEESEESEETDSKESEDKGKPKKKNGFKKRVDKLNRRLTEKESEVQYWRNEAMKSQRPQEASAAQVTDASKKPVAENFDTHDAFIEALTDWKVDQKAAKIQAQDKDNKLKSEFESQIQAHNQRLQAFVKKHDDFDGVISDVDDINMSMAVREVIVGSENGPDLMYALAKDREEYKRICGLSPIAAARELGRFEAKIKSQDTPSIEEKKKPSAPKPITPVNASASVSAKDPDEMDFHEYKKWRLANAR